MKNLIHSSSQRFTLCILLQTSVTCLSYWLRQVRQDFHSSGFITDVDLDPGCTLNKKIRNAQLAQYNFILGQWQQLSLSSLSPPPLLFLSFRNIDFLSALFLSKWWERRRRRATRWMCAPETTRSTESAPWRSALSVWSSSRAAEAEALKRSSKGPPKPRHCSHGRCLAETEGRDNGCLISAISGVNLIKSLKKKRNGFFPHL